MSHSFSLHPSLASSHSKPQPLVGTAQRLQPRPLLERLADWSDRRAGQHHHLGRWTTVWIGSGR